MAHSALRLRAGALAAAGALTLGGLVVASPAAAEPIEPLQPTIELSQTSFPAGDWEGGFTVTGSGFDPSIATAQFTIGEGGENGGGALYTETIDVAEDGTVNAEILPDRGTRAPDANGYPRYTASVAQDPGVEGEPWIFSNVVELTITAGASLDIPFELNVNEVAAGITAQFAGFAAGEEVDFGFGLFRWNEEDGEQLIAEEYGTATAVDGAGTITAAFAEAQVGDYIRIFADGLESGRIAEAWVNVVAVPAPAPAPAPVDPAPAPAAPAGDVNRLPDTGVDLGIGFAALALLVLGAGAIVVTRRVRAAQH